MRHDSRLSRMLHALIHMDRMDGTATSDMLAQMLNTNPVVVRRTMAGLRDQGLVRSEKGHGGGWALARPLDEISLLDIYKALGEPQLFAIDPGSADAACLVEQAVHAELGEALAQARSQLLDGFARTTLGDLARQFEKRLPPDCAILPRPLA